MGTSRVGILPDSKPKMTDVELERLMRSRGLSMDLIKQPLWIAGIRGYYKTSMGEPRVNDRGLYDDALFIYSSDCFRSFNGNTDPAKKRPGFGTKDSTKGMASLQEGSWLAYQFGKHKGQYLALCQRANVTVRRDGFNDSYYPSSGQFGINIHKGGYANTNSDGCQTVYPEQYDGPGGFITVAQQLAVDYFGIGWNTVLIPYVLVEM